jgi:hypothetical protein
VLVGLLKPVARGKFFDSYQQTFGPGSIDAEGPELSSYGNALFATPGTSNALADVVYGESFDKTSGAGALAGRQAHSHAMLFDLLIPQYARAGQVQGRIRKGVYRRI